MNPTGFNPRHIIINTNSNFAYMPQLPMTPMQFPPMFNWPAVPVHPLYRQLMFQQNMAMNNPQTAGVVFPPMNENMFGYTTYNTANQQRYGERQEFLRGILPRNQLDNQDSSSVEEILKKEEYIGKKEDFLSIGDTSSEEGQRFTSGAKIEFKIEESVSIEAKLEHGSHEDKKVFGDDDDDYEGKQEAWDDDTVSEGPGNLMTSYEGNSKMNLKVQLKEMIDFLIAHFGRIREEDLIKERLKYQYNPILAQVFEVLYSKYSCTFKTRAEIVKYITRKAFSTIKNNSKKEADTNSKEACKALCQRYFQVSSEEIQSSGVDIENRERFLQLLFPYQKNSKNKLQDMELISKLMSSKEFYEDYCLYVQDLDTILEADNNRKLSKFLTFILTCINKGQIQSIMKYKRVPWLKSWLDNTKIVARELAFNIKWKADQKTDKKTKKETSCQNKGKSKTQQIQEAKGASVVIQATH